MTEQDKNKNLFTFDDMMIAMSNAVDIHRIYHGNHGGEMEVYLAMVEYVSKKVDEKLQLK